MTVKLRIIIGAIAAFVVMLLLLLWAFFAYQGKTPIDPFIYQLASLITIVVGLVSAFFGHQSASRDAGAGAVFSTEIASSHPLVAPPPGTLVSDVQPAAPTQSSAPATPAPTLQ